MNCSKCGKQVDEGQSFCMYCGAPVEQAQTQAPVEQTIPQPQGQWQQPQQSQPQPKKSKTPLIIGIVACVVVVVAAIVLVLLFVAPGFLVNKPAPVAPPVQTEPQPTPVEPIEPVEPAKPAIDDDRLEEFDGEIYTSVALPFSFILPPDWTVEADDAEKLRITNATGNGTVTLYSLPDIGVQTILDDKTGLIEAAVSDAGGTSYDVNSEQSTNYYGVSWYEINASTGTADGEYVYLLIAAGDNGKGGALVYTFALYFGTENTVPIDDMLGGLDVLHSLIPKQ